jgi:hypothetical protein
MVTDEFNNDILTLRNSEIVSVWRGKETERTKMGNGEHFSRNNFLG